VPRTLQQASSSKKVRPATEIDLADAERGMAADEAGGFSGEESARDMGERIRKVRADIAETINLHQSNEQNLKIMRKKVRHPCMRWFGAAVVSARCTPASMFAVVVRVCLSGWGEEERSNT
jgi:hypothetical protein